MARLSRCPIHDQVISTAREMLKTSGVVELDRVLKRSGHWQMRKSIQWWFVRERLEEGLERDGESADAFGALIPLASEFFRRTLDHSNQSELYNIQQHPEKFVAGRGRGSRCVGWATFSSDVGIVLGRSWQQQCERYVKGGAQKVNAIRLSRRQPPLRIESPSETTALL